MKDNVSEEFPQTLLSTVALKCGRPWKGSVGSMSLQGSVNSAVTPEQLRGSKWKFFTFPMHTQMELTAIASSLKINRVFGITVKGLADE